MPTPLASIGRARVKGANKLNKLESKMAAAAGMRALMNGDNDQDCDGENDADDDSMSMGMARIWEGQRKRWGWRQRSR